MDHSFDHQTGANLGANFAMFATATAVTDNSQHGLGKTSPMVGVLIIPAGQHMVSASHRTRRDVKAPLYVTYLHCNILRVFSTLLVCKKILHATTYQSVLALGS